MPRHVSPLHYALVVIGLLLSLAPLPATAAQPAPNPCPDGQVYLPDQDMCVPADQVPTVDPMDPPTETPDDPNDGAGQPGEPAGNLASFTLYHLACDNDFEAAAVRDAGGLGPTNGCLTFGKPPFTYTIAANGTPITTATLDATERNYARFAVDTPVPTGTLTITIAPVGAYITELVSCALSVGDGFGQIVEPPIVGTSATLATEPDQDIECWVYNVTRASGDGQEAQGEDESDGQGVVADPSEQTGADITIATYVCPAGTTATDDLVATCTQRASGIPFSLVSASETLATETSDAEGDILFEDVPPNDYGIAAALPAGYGEPIVICYHAFATGVVEEGAEDIVLGNQVRFTVFGDGESLECAWYNVPAPGPDNGPNVFIEARTCSPGTSISASMTVFDAQGLCQTFYVDLEFRVLNVDQVIATARTNDDFLSPGQVFFTKLPEPASGAYAVTAGVREGERTLAVFCDQDFGDGTFQVVPVRVTGDRMDQELGMAAGDTLRCSWFIEMSPLMTGTHPPDSPVQEAAPEEPGEESTPTAAAGQDATDPGETLVDPQEGQASPAADAEAGDPGSEASGEPGITVLTRRCPPEVAGQEVVALDEVCTEPASGFTFDILVDDEPAGTYVTDATGALAVPAELGPGVYLFRHQPAADQLELTTVCYSVYANGSTATGRSSAVGSAMSEIFLTYDGVSSITCTFYFVMDAAAREAGDSEDSPDAPDGPPQDPATPAVVGGEEDAASGTPALTLTFLVCPEGTDPAAEPAALEQTCAIESVERSFMLTLDNFTTAETVVGTGRWTFNDLVVYADIGAARTSRVSCTSDWIEGAEQVPATSLLENGLLTITLEHPDTMVSCNWFIFAQ